MRKIFCLTWLIFSCGCLYAQVSMTNNGTLSILPSTDVHIDGGLTNSSSAALTNNGTLSLKGNLTNNQASMAVGTGTLQLNGSSAQTVNGAQTFKTNNLVTNNSSGITLSNSLSVSGTHTFTAGIVSSASSSNFLIYQSGSSYTGSGNSKHVQGWVKKLGTTAFTFPVGNGTYLREMAISNLTGTPEFNAQYSGATSNTSDIQSPLLSVDPYEYWTLNEVSGGATAQVTLNWDKSKINFPNWALMDIRLAQYTGGYWTNRGAGATGSPSTTGSIMSPSLSSFGPMVIGSTSLILPLLFLDIHANRLQDYTVITWQTTNEENVVRLEVQRSPNGADFTTIGTVAPHNKKQTQTYTYNDTSAINGISYYRVKSMDFDGKILYTKIVAVSVNRLEWLSLLSNPVRNNITLVATGIPPTNYIYQLLATDGKVVLRGSVKYDGSGKMNIPLPSALPPGTYLLLIGHQKTYIHKVVVQ